MRKLKFEDIEFNVTEEVFDYPPTYIEPGKLHEPDTYKYALSILKTFDDNDVFIDIGGCFGIFSLMIQKGTAIVFEPSPENAAIIARNMALNPEKNIKLMPFALANESGINYYVKRHQLPGMTKTIFGEGDLKTAILDDFEIEGNVKMIKVDTEGHDNEVLLGAKRFLEKYHPIIIIENPPDNWLFNMGYKIKHLYDNLNMVLIYEL